MTVSERLRELGITIPQATPPIANYVPFVLSGNILIISGQLCLESGILRPEHTGKISENVSEKSGYDAARLCAINLLAQIQFATGDLSKVKRCLRLGGFINCTPDFSALPAIMNGASDLMVAVFGEAGKHVRTTVGVAQLPLNAAVEIEAMFELV